MNSRIGSAAAALLAALALSACTTPELPAPTFVAPADRLDPATGSSAGQYGASDTAVFTATQPSATAVRPYVIPTPSPSSPALPQGTQLGAQLAAPALPGPGAPVYGRGGIVGTVGSSNGSVATVAPVGGGAPGILLPNGNGTAMLTQPGAPPTIVITRP